MDKNYFFNYFLNYGPYIGLFSYVIYRTFYYSWLEKSQRNKFHILKENINSKIFKAEKKENYHIVHLYKLIRLDEQTELFNFKLLIRENKNEYKPQNSKKNSKGQIFDLTTYIMDLGTTHLLIYNKFMVFRQHVLVITREGIPQQKPLTLEDLCYTWIVMNAIEGIAFYNSNEKAGASVDHKHLQVVKRKFLDTGIIRKIDLQAKTCDSFDGKITEFNIIKIDLLNDFMTVCIKLRDIKEHEDVFNYGKYLQCVYEAAYNNLNIDSDTCSFNLIFTKRWLLLVLRKQDKAYDVSMNSLSVIGSFLLTSEEKMKEFHTLTPQKIFKEILVSRA